MRKILDTIIETDREAQKLAAAAEEKQQSLALEIETQKQTMRQMYMERAQSRLDKIRAEEEAEAQRLTTQYKNRAQDNLARLRELCKTNEKKWIEDIFQKITTP